VDGKGSSIQIDSLQETALREKELGRSYGGGAGDKILVVLKQQQQQHLPSATG
jgi:hypothetical protein